MYGTSNVKCDFLFLSVVPNPVVVLHVQHYSAVMKYISQGPMLLDVHMHRPHTNSRNFMDALLAFWPGLQVQKLFITWGVHVLEHCYKHMM
jgi:mannosidase alpha-like ER degradation enhancer 3